MDSFKDVLEAAQMYCKAQMAEPTYNLYIDGLEPISFEDSSHITLSVRNDFICKIVTDRTLACSKRPSSPCWALMWTSPLWCPAPRPTK